MKSIFLFGMVASCLMWSQVYGQEAAEEANRESDFDIELEAEYRYFYDEAQFADQKDHFPAFAIRPKYSVDWKKQKQSLIFEGFFRLDVDEKRTHGDIRELYYQKVLKKWELSLGLKKVYWGVAESNHLVDIVNQTDAVESFDGEQKLGQPMAHLSTFTNKYGTFDFFYLPYHRRRVFSGKFGRFRFPQVIDAEDLGYESSAEELNQDFAFRWSHYFGPVDIGLSHFYGNGREPLFTFDQTGINAFYPIINQSGLDLQITHSAFLWKFEAIYRTADNNAPEDIRNFIAYVGGLEYTFSNVNGRGLDIGVLGEYLYDERDEWAFTALQNDVFFGSRLGFNDANDSAILFGGIADLDKSTRIFSVEASRRFGQSWTGEVEGRFFTDIDENELIFSNFQNDSFLRISISKYL